MNQIHKTLDTAIKSVRNNLNESVADKGLTPKEDAQIVALSELIQLRQKTSIIEFNRLSEEKPVSNPLTKKTSIKMTVTQRGRPKKVKSIETKTEAEPIVAKRGRPKKVTIEATPTIAKRGRPKTVLQEDTQIVSQEVKAKRGRPKKIVQPVAQEVAQIVAQEVKAKRGRPKKIETVAPVAVKEKKVVVLPKTRKTSDLESFVLRAALKSGPAKFEAIQTAATDLITKAGIKSANLQKQTNAIKRSLSMRGLLVEDKAGFASLTPDGVKAAQKFEMESKVLQTA